MPEAETPTEEAAALERCRVIVEPCCICLGRHKANKRVLITMIFRVVWHINELGVSFLHPWLNIVGTHRVWGIDEDEAVPRPRRKKSIRLSRIGRAGVH